MYRIKIILAISLFSVFCLFISGGIMIHSVTKFFIGYLREDLFYQTDKTSKLIEQYHINNPAALSEMIKKMPFGLNAEINVFDANFKKIASNFDTGENFVARLTDNEKSRISELKSFIDVWQGHPPSEKRMYCVAPINFNGVFSGGVMATINFHTGENRRIKMQNQVLFALMVTFVFAIVFGIFLSRWITRPLLAIYEATLAFSKGDFSKRIDINRNDELGRTAGMLNDMAQKLDELIKTHRDFMADVSHEFKTPLTTIRGCSEAILDGVVSDEEERNLYHKRIIEEANSLSFLVNDLLEISKLESGALKIETYPVNAVDVIYKTADKLKFMAEERRVRFDISAGPGDAIDVIAEEQRFFRVIKNLLENSIKHSPEGGTVKISFEKADGVHVFKISDAGEGIPPEMREKVFLRFYRLDHSRARTSGGTGLGLPICREIVIAFGGKIEFIDPEPGFSTTVRFTLKNA